MNTITHLFGQELTRAIGWTILHSLWQGMIIALLLTIVLIAFRKRSPQIRYIAGLGALCTLFILAVITFTQVYAPAGTTVSDDLVGVSVGIDMADATTSVASGISADTTQPFLHSYREYFDRNSPLIVLIWMLGVFILTLRMMGELAYLQHLRYYRTRLAPTHWQHILDELAVRLGISRSVVLKESFRVNTPMVIGYLKPIVLIPAGLISNLTPQQVESVLAHELAHIRRYDYLVNIFQSLIEILLFFNPAIWWISSFIRGERENCCDDLAIECTGDEVTFVKTLAKLEEWRVGEAGLALAFTGSAPGVLGRIQRILNSERSSQLPFRIFWSATILLAGILFVAFRPVAPADRQAQDSTEITRLDDISDAVEPGTPVAGFATDSIPGRPDIKADDRNYQTGIGYTTETTDAEPADQLEAITGIGEAREDWYEEADEETDAGVQQQTDTVPEEIKQLEKQIRALQLQMQEKQLVLERQLQELEMVQLQKQKEIKKLQSQQQLRHRELQKQMQQISNQQEMKDQELRIKENKMRRQLLETEEKLQDATYEAIQEENKEKEKQLEARINELSKEKIDFEQALQRLQLDVEKEMLELEKMALEMKGSNSLDVKDKQLETDELQVQILELDQRSQELQLQMQAAQHELRNKMLQLEEQLLRARKKYREE